MSTQNSINSTYPIGVVSGGTGAATLTGVLLGNGTSAVTAVTAGDYGVLISSSSGVPSWLANGTTGQVLTATSSGTPSWAAPATSGTVTSLTEGTGITLSPSTITSTGSIGLTVPVVVSSGGTGAITLTGVLTGNGTSAVTANTVTQYDVLVGGASNAVGSVGPGSSGQVLQSGGASANPAYSTATYPATTTINQLLYSSANNTVGGVTAGDYGVLISSSSGVPSWLANGTTGQVLTATTSGTPSWANAAAGGITTIDGNSGSVTGSTITVSGSGIISTSGSGSTLSLAITNPIPIANGGTNATSMATADGVVYYDGTRLVTTAAGTATQVLTSNGAGMAPTFQAAGSGGIGTIDGDSGSVTGSTVTIETHKSADGGTALFTGSGSTLTLTFSDQTNQNTSIGYGAFSTSTIAAGGQNTAFGYGTMAAIGNSDLQNCAFGILALGVATGGAQQNCAFGAGTLATLGAGIRNTAFGDHALTGLQATSSGNVAIGALAGFQLNSATGTTTVGFESLFSATSDSYSTILGYQAAFNVLTGSYNVCIGYEAGYNLNGSEASNVIIANPGVTGINNTIIIGTQGNGIGEQDSCYIAGIYGVTVTGTAVLMNSSGKLGTVASSQRFKENIVDMGDQSAALYKLRPVTFNYISDDNKSRAYGLIAEEVEQVLPDLVVHNLETGVADSVKYHEMPAMLLNELQKLAARVEQLESLLQSLKQG